MEFSRAERQIIYKRTNGRCHVCGNKVYFTNYGQFGERGAWEIDHSRAVATGGTDRLNNLLPACISCNRSKGTVSSRAERARHGRKRAPLSSERRAAAKRDNAVVGSVIGGVVLGALAGPWGAAAGAAAGAYLGAQVDPDAD